MKNTKPVNLPPSGTFEFFRLSHSKQFSGFCPNTIRSFFEEGLPSYRIGKCVLVSKVDLEAFVRARALTPAKDPVQARPCPDARAPTTKRLPRQTAPEPKRELVHTDKRLTGKAALITGAASGIGRAAAMLFGAQGATVHCADLDVAGASATAQAIVAAGGTAASLNLDVTFEEAWSRVITDIVARHGRLDILVNCAGISFACPVVETSLDDWRRVIAVNLDGVFLGTKRAIAVMHEHGGSIINVSSASGVKPSPGASAYSTSKAAVCMFTKAVAKECGEKRYPIRVNTVCPGAVKTPLWTSMPFFRDLMAKTGSEEAAFEELARTLPGGRFIEPEAVAAAILYLASDESSSVTGTDLIIDNGFTL